jgi:hypothetical protein
MLQRIRGSADQIRDMLLKEFARCGFKPKNCKVVEVKSEFATANPSGGGRGASAFYLNLGYLRGLDPDEVWRLLHETTGKKQFARAGFYEERRFPDLCGGRKVIEAIARLEQRVERPPAMMAPDESEEAGDQMSEVRKQKAAVSSA